MVVSRRLIWGGAIVVLSKERADMTSSMSLQMGSWTSLRSVDISPIIAILSLFQVLEGSSVARARSGSIL